MRTYSLGWGTFYNEFRKTMFKSESQNEKNKNLLSIVSRSVIKDPIYSQYLNSVRNRVSEPEPIIRLHNFENTSWLGGRGVQETIML